MVAGLEATAGQLRIPIPGIDSDNDSVFIYETLTEYCTEKGIEFTRSRAYRKSDQAWVEQKNRAEIRRFLDHGRYSGQMAGKSIPYLHGAMRPWVNYFQHCLKLMEKTRNGSKVTECYNAPATPCERVMDHEKLGADTKARLKERRAQLDPVALPHTIQETQSALMAIVSPEVRATPTRESLEQLLVKLPYRWRQHEEAASPPKKEREPGTWRTRPDPFEGVCAKCWDGCRNIPTPTR